MQQLLEKAFASIHRGQYSAAKNYLQEIVKSPDDELLEKKTEAYLALIDISKHEKKITDYQAGLDAYLSFLLKNKKSEDVLKYISEIEENPSKYTMFFQTRIKERKIEALDDLGHFQKSLEEMESYLELLINLKHYDQAEIFAEKTIKKFPHQIHWQLYLVKIYIGKFQYKQAIARLESVLLSLDSEELTTWGGQFAEMISHQQDDSKKTADYLETLNCAKFKNKSDYSKLINSFINQPSFELMVIVARKLINSGHFEMAKSFLTFLEKNYKKQIKKNDRLLKKIKAMTASRRTDEIEAKSLSAEEIQEIKLERLKIDLDFIKKYESEDNYKKILKKINKLDPFFVDGDEELVSNEISSQVSKTTKKEKLADPDEILRNLLSEISYYSNKPSGKENVLDNLEKELSKTIELYQNEILSSNYNDYILMLYSFKLYDSALLLVNKVKERLDTGLENLKPYLDISYLEIILKNEMGRTYDSLEILNFILSQLPLSRDEKICFLYMAGESYYKLGQGREALKYYRKILKLTDGYRLTKERMKLLEKV